MSRSLRLAQEGRHQLTVENRSLPRYRVTALHNKGGTELYYEYMYLSTKYSGPFTRTRALLSAFATIDMKPSATFATPTTHYFVEGPGKA